MEPEPSVVISRAKWGRSTQVSEPVIRSQLSTTYVPPWHFFFPLEAFFGEGDWRVFS